MNTDGSAQTPLVRGNSGTWSPGGKRIVFRQRVGGRGQFQLFMINADGTGERQLTNPPGLSGFPNWGEVRGPAK